MAVLLGIVLGIGLAIAPTFTPSHYKALMEQNAVGAKLEMRADSGLSQRNSDPILLGLLAGLVVAVPFYVVVRKRNH